MKFEREIPIGLDARRKNDRGAEKAPPPPPNGIRVNSYELLQHLTVTNEGSFFAVYFSLSFGK